jgi:hypothetical protein
MPNRPRERKIHTYHERAVGLGGVNDVSPSFEESGAWTWERSPVRRLVGVTTILFWASAAILAVMVVLTWVASGLRDE